MTRALLLLFCLLMACPVFAEDAPNPTPDSVVEGGYTAPATPTPVPTPEPPPLRDDPLLQHAVELASRIDLLAEDDTYRLQFFGAYAETVKALSYGAHIRPSAAYELPGQALMDALNAGADADNAIDFTRYEFRSDLMNELLEVLSGRRESTELSCLMELARSKYFTLDAADGCGVMILLYEEAAPVGITWVSDGGCVCMSAFFLPDETLAAAQDASAVSAWFTGVGMPTVTFQEVPLT